MPFIRCIEFFFNYKNKCFIGVSSVNIRFVCSIDGMMDVMRKAVEDEKNITYFPIIAAKNQRIFKKINADIQIKEADDDKKKEHTPKHMTRQRKSTKSINA